MAQLHACYVVVSNFLQAAARVVRYKIPQMLQLEIRAVRATAGSADMHSWLHGLRA